MKIGFRVLQNSYLIVKLMIETWFLLCLVLLSLTCEDMLYWCCILCCVVESWCCVGVVCCVVKYWSYIIVVVVWCYDMLISLIMLLWLEVYEVKKWWNHSGLYTLIWCWFHGMRCLGMLDYEYVWFRMVKGWKRCV